MGLASQTMWMVYLDLVIKVTKNHASACVLVSCLKQLRHRHYFYPLVSTHSLMHIPKVSFGNVTTKRYS